ncbi:hypothetical protein M5D96_001569, partial [Drosophila gunungcola]
PGEKIRRVRGWRPTISLVGCVPVLQLLSIADKAVSVQRSSCWTKGLISLEARRTAKTVQRKRKQQSER